MIYFNIQQPQAHPTDNSHLTLVRRNLAIALDKNRRLVAMLGEAGQRIAELEEERNDCMFDWQGATAFVDAVQRVTELEAKNEQLEEALNSCVFDWQGAEKRVKQVQANWAHHVDRQATRIAELTEENATLRKEVDERREKAKVYLEQIWELNGANEQLQEQLDNKGMGMWEVVAMKDRALGEYAQIVAELKAELEASRELLHKAEERTTNEKWWSIERLRIINDKQAQRIAELGDALLSSRKESDRIAVELQAEKDELMAENVRLTGQIHALLTTIEASL